MTGKRMIYIIIAIAVSIVAYFGWKLTARSAYESAEYSILESDSPFEIRQYADLMLVTTDMQFASQGDDGSFMRLFKYITGANDGEQKIAMTTPVFMERQADEANGQMGFVIPQELSEHQIPDPSSDQVTIRKRVGGRFAVVRFSGRINEKSAIKAEKELRAWMARMNLIANGEAESAGYDPPWTPGALRRNEVLIRLQ